MRRAAVLLWLIRHPGVVAVPLLLLVPLLGYRAVRTVVRLLAGPALPAVSFAALPADYVPGEVLIGLSAGDRALDAAVRAAGALKVEAVRGTGLFRLKLAPGRSVPDALAAVAGERGVAWAEPNYRVHSCRAPEGPRFQELWGMHNIGRSFTSRSCGEVRGSEGSDIAACKAWDASLGSRKVLVGVIDTGIDYAHPNLKANIWTNPGEIPDNGVDDDKNGYVDDVHGYDFANRKGDPKDDNGHGTHVAGTIGAAGADGTGVVGVNWEVRLMALKFLDANGWGNIADAAEALAYARSFGVRVTNNSWGGGGMSRSLYEAVRASRGLFVAAAGNAASDTDLVPAYPAGYDLPNILSVAAADPRDQVGCFSNWGETSVDVAAPGVAVLSTLPTYPCTLTERGLQQGYDYLDGTSMATPHVAGASALSLARHAGESDEQRRHRLMATARRCGPLRGRCVSNGSIDLNAAIAARLVPPIPSAGSDTATPPGVPVTLDAAASCPYPGRSIASFVWSERGKVLRRSRHPQLRYESTEIGVHEIELAVVDNESQASRDRVCVEVAAQVAAGKAIAFERRDRQTLVVTLDTHDVRTGMPVAGASVSLLLATPGGFGYRADGRTDEAGRFRAVWRAPGRMLPGEYAARLLALSHDDWTWDRKRLSATWRG